MEKFGGGGRVLTLDGDRLEEAEEAPIEVLVHLGHLLLEAQL
jgi:hypothetical protein